MGGSPVISSAWADNFIDVDGTLLTAHTPDSGGMWSAEVPSNFQIQSNNAFVTSGNSAAWIDTGLIALTVEVTVGVVGDISCVARFVDVNNYTMVQWTSTGVQRIFEKVAGSFISRVLVFAAGHAVGDTITLVDDGASITLLANGVNVASYATTLNAGSTIQGFRLSNGAAVSKIVVI